MHTDVGKWWESGIPDIPIHQCELVVTFGLPHPLRNQTHGPVSYRLALTAFRCLNRPQSMKHAKTAILGTLLLLLGFAFTGCTTRKGDSSIPWSRPADWEGQIPGLSNPNMGR